MIQVASGASAAYDRAIAETQTSYSEGIPQGSVLQPERADLLARGIH